MIDFPDAPNIDQEFAGGYFTWRWDGAKWRRLPTDPGAPLDPPALTAVAPDQVPVSRVTQVLSVTGISLTAAMTLEVDGADVVTTFISSTQLQCTIDPLLDFALGVHEVTSASAPGAPTFTTFVPPPVIDNISPTGGSTGVGPSGVRVTVTGSGFVRQVGSFPDPAMIPGTDAVVDGQYQTFDSFSETSASFDLSPPLLGPGQTAGVNIVMQTQMAIGGAIETSATATFTWTGA
jgi:hypothetical protein